MIANFVGLILAHIILILALVGWYQKEKCEAQIREFKYRNKALSHSYSEALEEIRLKDEYIEGLEYLNNQMEEAIHEYEGNLE